MCCIDKLAMMALQQQLLASEKGDDKDRIENGSSAMAGDASPGSMRVRSRTVTSVSSIKSAAAEKKPLMPNQLIKEEDVEEGAVCHMFYFYRCIVLTQFCSVKVHASFSVGQKAVMYTVL